MADSHDKTLRIYLLGPLRCFYGDNAFAFSAPPKTMPLWIYLLLNRQQALERAQLAYTLWPDEPESVARTNLRRHLHYLHHALPPAQVERPWLCIAGEYVQWNPAAATWLDAAEFERLGAVPTSLADAVALYAGDLAENLYEDWIFFERERLRALYFAYLGRLIQSCRADCDYGRAIHYCQQLLRGDPFREDVLRQLLVLRYESGDRAGALQEYGRFARLLGQEMRIKPMPETTALYDSILRNSRPSGVWTLADGVGAAVPQPTALLPFVGRDVEMERLRQLWSRAAHGHGDLAWVSGEAGIGKTRLARELALWVEAQGGRVLYGTTTPASTQPYQAIVEALESVLPLAAAMDLQPVWVAALNALLPGLQERRSAPPLPALDPERERARLFEAVANCLIGLARSRPVLLILEDLHWSGEAGLALTAFLARRASLSPLLILATYRSEEVTHPHPLRKLRHDLQRESVGESLALGKLSRQAVAALLARMPGREGTSDEAAQQLFAESEGNPLFLELFYQHVLESTAAGHSLRWDAIASGNLPENLRAIIVQRLERLTPQARDMAEIAAIVGLSFDIVLVSEASGWDESQVQDSLSELLDRRLIREAGGRGRFAYTFAHHLIPTVLYADSLPHARTHRHRRIAAVMAELYRQELPAMAGAIASHYERGGAPEEAARYYLSAASYAASLYAGQETLASIERALALTAKPRLRFELLSLRESIYHRHGDRLAQQADLEQLVQLAQTLGDPDLRCDALRRQIVYHHVLGERQTEAAAIAQLEALAESLGAPRWQAATHQARAAYHLHTGQYDRAQSELEAAMCLQQTLDDVSGQIACYCLLAEIATQRGHFADVRAQLAQARQLAASQAANHSLVVQTLRTAAGATFAAQDFKAAAELAQQMLELCQEIGDREGEADARIRLGSTATRLFQIDAARRHYQDAEALYQRLGKKQGQAAVLVNAGLLHTRLGGYAEGQQAFRQAEALFETLGDLRGQAVSALNLGMVAFFQGEYTEAQAAAQRGLELARRMNSPAMEANALANLGAAERELGNLAAAIAHMEAGLSQHRKLEQLAEVGTDLCDLTVAYLRCGDLEAARLAAEEMLELHRRAPDTMMHPQYMLWMAGETCQALGDTQRARELYRQAHAILMEKAAAIPEPVFRETFLQLPFNRPICAAFAPTPHF